MFVEVFVEAHGAIPETVMRWRTIPGEQPRPISRVRYEPEDGPECDWDVVAVDAVGARSAAQAVAVEDSSAGTAILVIGGTHGLRLFDGKREIAEAYLLLSRDAILPVTAS